MWAIFLEQALLFHAIFLFQNTPLLFQKAHKGSIWLERATDNHGGVQRGFPPLPPAKYRHEIYHIYWYSKHLTAINRIVYNNNVPTKSGILKEKRRQKRMRKTRHLDIRLNDVEYKIISKKAELLDITMSEYVRQIALKKQVKGFKITDLNLPEEQCKGQLNLLDMI